MDPAELADAARQPQSGHGPWSHTDYLLGAVLDRLDAVWHATWGAVGGKVQMPKQYPRPGIADGASTPAPDPAAVAFIERMRAEHRAMQEAAQAQEAAEPADQADPHDEQGRG